MANGKPWLFPELRPFVLYTVGIRGHGKSYNLCELLDGWQGGLTLAVDPPCPPTMPPGYPAHYADLYAPTMPDVLPLGVDLVCIDEADRTLPNSGKPHPLAMDLVVRGRHLGALDPKTGRPLGISLALATQAPVLVSRHAWRMATHLRCYRITDDNDLERIASLDPAGLRPHLDLIRRLPPGVCVTWSLYDGVHAPGAKEAAQGKLKL